MPRRPSPALLLLGLGAVLVHELRFLAAVHGDLPALLSHHGHPALAVVSPATALLLAATLGRRGRLDSPWRCAACLLVIYAAQAVVEGVVAPGHLTGLAGVVGVDGWLAVPLMAAVALLVPRVRRLAHDALRRHGARRPRLVAPDVVALLGASLPARRCAPLARRAAGRAPPVLA